jgi:IS605 OrfB family transposase
LGIDWEEFFNMLRLYLLVSLELEIAEPTPDRLPTVVGVDVGQRYLATTATLTNQSRFYPGKRVRAKADHYTRLHKRLQKKGTRSATRRLIALSGRERRLKLQANHSIAKSIVTSHPHTLIGLEELTGIRERTKRRKRRRKKQGKGTEPVSKKARRANRHASQWAFAELHDLLSYKAALAGSLTIKVDADYTSQTCPYCGYADRRNRPGKGLLFICQQEQCPYRLRAGDSYMLHADLVGARNIAMRTLLTRQDWVRTGVLSVRPDVSDDETKAARLKRYAELRWSSDTSSSR